jgi:hypothetical protein
VTRNDDDNNNNNLFFGLGNFCLTLLSKEVAVILGKAVPTLDLINVIMHYKMIIFTVAWYFLPRCRRFCSTG